MEKDDIRSMRNLAFILFGIITVIAGSFAADTIFRELQVDDVNINGTIISVTNTDGDLRLKGNGTGTVIINDLSFPTVDGSNGQALVTDGAGAIGFGEPATAGAEGALNILSNAGFELGTDNWTASAGDFEEESIDVGFGNISVTWDASASTQTLESDAKTIPGVLKGQSCVASVYVSGDATLYDLKVLDGTSALIAENTDLTNNSTYTRFLKTFICPSSGTLSLVLEAQGDGAEIKIDQAFLGSNYLLKEDEATLDSSSLIWQGHHDSTCNWTGTSSSLASFPSDSTCSLTEILNVNMGTVTSQLSSGDALPGIVFTPKRTGQYEVCASGTHEISSGGNKALLALEYDGDYYDMQGSSAVDGSDQSPFRLCAIINVASLGGTVDVELHGAIQSSSVVINNDPDGEVTGDDRNVNWSIMFLSDSFPMISLQNSMTSNTATGQRAYVAKIDGAATPAIESQAGTWIDSITDNGVGDYTLNFSSDAFSSSPYCLVSNDENADNIVRAYSESTSSVTVRVKDTTPSFVEGDFTIICIGAR